MCVSLEYPNLRFGIDIEAFQNGFLNEKFVNNLKFLYYYSILFILAIPIIMAKHIEICSTCGNLPNYDMRNQICFHSIRKLGIVLNTLYVECPSS